MNRAEDGSKTIRSVENAFRILEELRHREQTGVTELAEAVGLSKATVHHYLATLYEQDFVERSESGYRLGLRPLSYGGIAREREKVFQIGKESVDRLANETGETARLVVERRRYCITIYQSTRRRDGVHTHLGTQEHLHSTAAGKAMLSAMDDDRIARIITGRELPRHTENTITSTEELRSEIGTIRSSGIAFDDREQFDDVRCVATALVTEDDGLLGAISVNGPIGRINDRAFHEEIPQQLRNTAGVIESDATYLDWMERD